MAERVLRFGASIRAAASPAPDWTDPRSKLTGTNDLSHPTWASGSATVDGRFLAKFAFSAPTAVRVWHEARVLKLLGARSAFDVPEVVGAGPDPACLATRIVEGGAPLSYERVRASLPARVDALGAELARFLASLHAPQILTLGPRPARRSSAYPRARATGHDRRAAASFHADDRGPGAYAGAPLVRLDLQQ